MYGSSPERPQEPGPPSKAGSASEDDDEEEAAAAAAAAATEEEQEEALLVPQVKVAEDGSLIIDEERSVHSSKLCHVLLCSCVKCIFTVLQLDGGGATSEGAEPRE